MPRIFLPAATPRNNALLGEHNTQPQSGCTTNPFELQNDRESENDSDESTTDEEQNSPDLLALPDTPAQHEQPVRNEEINPSAECPWRRLEYEIEEGRVGLSLPSDGTAAAGINGAGRSVGRRATTTDDSETQSNKKLPKHGTDHEESRGVPSTDKTSALSCSSQVGDNSRTGGTPLKTKLQLCTQQQQQEQHRPFAAAAAPTHGQSDRLATLTTISGNNNPQASATASETLSMGRGRWSMSTKLSLVTAAAAQLERDEARGLSLAASLTVGDDCGLSTIGGDATRPPIQPTPTIPSHAAIPSEDGRAGSRVHRPQEEGLKQKEAENGGEEGRDGVRQEEWSFEVVFVTQKLGLTLATDDASMDNTRYSVVVCEKDGTVVSSAIAAAEVQIGDRVAAVGGVSTVGVGLSDVERMIVRGPRPMTIVFQRPCPRPPVNDAGAGGDSCNRYGKSGEGQSAPAEGGSVVVAATAPAVPAVVAAKPTTWKQPLGGLERPSRDNLLDMISDIATQEDSLPESQVFDVGRVCDDQSQPQHGVMGPPIVASRDGPGGDRGERGGDNLETRSSNPLESNEMGENRSPRPAATTPHKQSTHASQDTSAPAAAAAAEGDVLLPTGEGVDKDSLSISGVGAHRYSSGQRSCVGDHDTPHPEPQPASSACSRIPAVDVVGGHDRGSEASTESETRAQEESLISKVAAGTTGAVTNPQRSAAVGCRLAGTSPPFSPSVSRPLAATGRRSGGDDDGSSGGGAGGNEPNPKRIKCTKTGGVASNATTKETNTTPKGKRKKERAVITSEKKKNGSSNNNKLVAATGGAHASSSCDNKKKDQEAPTSVEVTRILAKLGSKGVSELTLYTHLSFEDMVGLCRYVGVGVSKRLSKATMAERLNAVFVQKGTLNRELQLATTARGGGGGGKRRAGVADTPATSTALDGSSAANSSYRLDAPAAIRAATSTAFTVAATPVQEAYFASSTPLHPPPSSLQTPLSPPPLRPPQPRASSPPLPASLGQCPSSPIPSRTSFRQPPPSPPPRTPISSKPIPTSIFSACESPSQRFGFQDGDRGGGCTQTSQPPIGRTPEAAPAPMASAPMEPQRSMETGEPRAGGEERGGRRPGVENEECWAVWDFSENIRTVTGGDKNNENTDDEACWWQQEPDGDDWSNCSSPPPALPPSLPSRVGLAATAAVAVPSVPRAGTITGSGGENGARLGGLLPHRRNPLLPATVAARDARGTMSSHRSFGHVSLGTGFAALPQFSLRSVRTVGTQVGAIVA